MREAGANGTVEEIFLKKQEEDELCLGDSRQCGRTPSAMMSAFRFLDRLQAQCPDSRRGMLLRHQEIERKEGQGAL